MTTRGLMEAGWRDLRQEIVDCTLCPRLVAWRRQVGDMKRRAYRSEDYWARPLPGFGDPNARLLILGLAPAAHGGNRTGRMFTGDSSVVLALGQIAFKAYRRVLRQQPDLDVAPGVRFGHGQILRLPSPRPSLVASYHPSRQNTQTGRLTAAMLDDVLAQARKLLT